MRFLTINIMKVSSQLVLKFHGESHMKTLKMLLIIYCCNLLLKHINMFIQSKNIFSLEQDLITQHDNR